MSIRKQIIRRMCAKEIKVAESSLSPVLKRIYAARAIEDDSELDTSLSSLLPFDQLQGIDQASALLVAAIQQKKRILIVGDFDADGATSTALAMRALKMFGAEYVDYLVPNRFAYGYGLTKELVEAASDYYPDMIVTVDNGIANHAGVTAARAKGITVIVTDHHLPAATLPDADVIVNPNLPDDKFASKCLAGVGVIFYVMLAVRKRLLDLNWFQLHGLSEPNMANLLDIVALGTVADLVPLDRNNRVLVSQGLKRMRAGRCIPAIPALLDFSKRDLRQVVCSDLGFAVASRLNAAGRLEDMSLGIECLLTDDPHRARELAYRLNELNLERRAIEKDMQVQAITALEVAQGKFKNNLPRGLCLYDGNWHQGVVGILASRLKDKFNRPVIVFAPGKEGEIKGSARSVEGLHIRDVLALINAHYPDLIIKFGGHAMAAGLSIYEKDYVDFAEKFDAFVSKYLSEEQLQHVIYSDGELSQDELNLNFAELLRDVMPWGQAFPEPMFDNIFRVIDQRIVGDKHLKLRLMQSERVIDAIAFFVDTQEWPNHRCEYIKAVYRLDINEYKEQRKLQLIIDYLEPVDNYHISR